MHTDLIRSGSYVIVNHGIHPLVYGGYFSKVFAQFDDWLASLRDLLLSQPPDQQERVAWLGTLPLSQLNRWGLADECLMECISYGRGLWSIDG